MAVPCLDATYSASISQFDKGFSGMSKVCDRPSSGRRVRSSSPVARSTSPWGAAPATSSISSAAPPAARTSRRGSSATGARPPVAPCPFATVGSTGGSGVASPLKSKKEGGFSVLGQHYRPMYANKTSGSPADRGSVFSALSSNGDGKVTPKSARKTSSNNDAASVLFDSPLDDRLKQRFNQAFAKGAVRNDAHRKEVSARRNGETAEVIPDKLTIGKRCPSPTMRESDPRAAVGPAGGKRCSTPERRDLKQRAGGYWQSAESVAPKVKVDASYRIKTPWV